MTAAVCDAPSAMVQRQQPWTWLGLVLLVAIVVRASTVTTGLHMDDLAQRAMVGGAYPALRPWWDLYRFSGLSAEGNGSLMSAGALPWWSAPELRLSAFRPLASALVWCDAKLGSPVLAHVHSLAWWVAMLAMAYRLVARTLSHRWALVATLLFALDDCHIYPLSWLANRAALVSTVFGLLALEAHLRWREDEWRPGLWAAPLLTALSVLAGEYGFSVFGFLLAYALVVDRASLASRILSISGHVAVALGLLALARGLGYGAAHSAVYLDPLRDPLGFAAAAMERWPLLMADMLSGLPIAQLQLYALRVHPIIMVLAAALPLALLAAVFRGRKSDRRLRWVLAWALGAALALVPVLASFVSARLTVAAALGTHVVLGGLLLASVDALRNRGPLLQRVAAGLGVIGIAGAHIGGAAYWGRVETDNLRRFNAAGVTLAATLDVPDEVAAKERWVLLSCRDPMTLIYPPVLRWLDGHTQPRSWWVLSMAPSGHDVVRVSDRALEFSVRDGAMLNTPIEQFFRHPSDAFEAGDTVELEGLRIEILELAGSGGVRRVRYTFDRRLDHPSLRFLILGGNGFVRYPLGPVGAIMSVPPGMNPLSAADGVGS